MITITVCYPEHECTETEVAVFIATVDEGAHEDLHANLSGAAGLIEAAIGDIDGVIGLDTDDSGDLTVAYDPAEAPWRNWYQLVAQAIEIYYMATFQREITITVTTEPHSDL